jgi:MarR family transcriptional regulator, transcriptional regulator for hemolysin
VAEIRDIWLQANHMLHVARQIINRDLRSLNLTGAEGNILLHLFTQGEDMRQEQLVEELEISKPAVSRGLDSLAAKGFITRQTDPDDRRAHRVLLTDTARAVGPAIERIYDQVYTRAVRGIRPEELDYLVALIARLSHNFEREATE